MNIAQNRLNLDWCRGLAALAVAALHCREIEWVGLKEFISKRGEQSLIDNALAWLFSPIVWGSAGVAVFFVLSGYVIHSAAASRRISNPNWKLDAREFYFRRFVRIYPVLIGAMLLTYALDSISLHLAPDHHKLGDLSLSSAIGNVLALQGILVKPYGSNGALWTIAVEIQFYAAYPILLYLRRRLSLNTLLASIAALSLLSHALLSKIDITFFTSYYISWFLGFYAAELKAKPDRLPSANRLRWLSAITGVAGCAAFFASTYMSMLLWSASFFFYLLSLIIRQPASSSLIRTLSFVGVFSYSLYAVHMPSVVLMSAILNSGMKSYSMLNVLFILLATTFTAYLAYVAIEKQCVRWLALRSA